MNKKTSSRSRSSYLQDFWHWVNEMQHPAIVDSSTPVPWPTSDFYDYTQDAKLVSH